MYCRHFNLDKKPFQLSSDNSFLWLGHSHTRAIEDLKQGIEGPDSLLVLTGDVGTGKTTLVHEIISTLPSDTDCAHITDPSLELHYLFLTIAKGLGFENQYRKGEKFTPILISFLQGAKQRGRKALIIIDEVHLVPDRFLAQLISWSQCPGLTIILAGQLEFHDVIAKSQGRSWKDIVDVHAMLVPLDERETQTYINQRLAHAGARRKIFILPAVRQAYLFSKGIPRLINIACDQAMIAAFSKDMKRIDASIFQEAVGILKLPQAGDPDLLKPDKKPFRENPKPSKKILAGLTAALALGICAYQFLPWQPSRLSLEIADPVPKVSVPKVFKHPPVAEPENLTAPSEKVVRVPIQPMEKETFSPPLTEEAQVEFYSPPEKVDLSTGSVPPAPPKPEPVDMEKFINEVFMIQDPLAHGLKPLAPDQTKMAAASPVLVSEPPRQKAPSHSNTIPPEPDAIIDWLLNKKTSHPPKSEPQ